MLVFSRDITQHDLAAWVNLGMGDVTGLSWMGGRECGRSKAGSESEPGLYMQEHRHQVRERYTVVGLALRRGSARGDRGYRRREIELTCSIRLCMGDEVKLPDIAHRGHAVLPPAKRERDGYVLGTNLHITQ